MSFFHNTTTNTHLISTTYQTLLPHKLGVLRYCGTSNVLPPGSIILWCASCVGASALSIKQRVAGAGGTGKNRLIGTQAYVCVQWWGVGGVEGGCVINSSQVEQIAGVHVNTPRPQAALSEADKAR